MDVVILAGGRTSAALREASGTEFRADVPFRGRTMAEIVVDAVSGIGAPLVVGGHDGQFSRQVPAGTDFVGSISNAIAAVTEESFLLATVDLPFLTRPAVEDFVSACDAAVGLNYPIIPIGACNAAFPGLKRTTLKLKEGCYTGGNLGLVRTEDLRRCLPVLEQAYALRKKPLHLANMVGLATLTRVALGQVVPRILSVASLERDIGAFLGMKVRAVQTSQASIGTDIDTAEQYLAIVGAPVPQE